MRTYVIPPSIKDGEREKIIGGVLDLAQAGWILVGLLITFGVFLLLSPLSKILGVIMGLTIATPITVVFGFLKIKGYSVLKYIKYKRQFNVKQKILPNKRVIK